MKSKVYEPVATGSTVARDLRDRFADVVNVKDYGAKGDGVTDDTVAFSSAAATGKVVFIPAGSYVLTSKVQGDFISLENVVYDPSKIMIRDAAHPEFHAFPTEYSFMNAMTDLGGDASAAGVTPWDWAKNIQGAFVDPYENKLVLSWGNSTGQTGIGFFEWDEAPEKRTYINFFSGLYDFIDHQETCLYRPSRAAQPLIVCRGNLYTAEGVMNEQNSLNAHVVSFEYPTAETASLTWSIMHVFKMFPLADWYSASPAGNKCRFCVSADGKYMIALAKKKSDDKWYYRIWDLPYILSKYAGAASSTVSPIDITGDKLYEFEKRLEDGENYTQGIYSDGTWIFNLIGSSTTTRMYKIKYEGIHNRASGTWKGIFPVPPDLAGVTKMEAESMFFAPFNGRMEMLLGVTCVDGSGHKYNRYFSPTVAVHGTRFNASVLVETYDNNVYGFIHKDLAVTRGNALGEGRLGGFFHRDKDDNAMGALYHQFSAGSDKMSFWTWTLYKNKAETDGYVLRFSDFGASGSPNAYFGPYAPASSALSENINLGRASHPWQNSYCASGQWTGSDERIKANIEDIDEAVFRAWGKVNFKVFQMRDAIAKKGEDAARLHVGVIAQQVRDAFASEGLDASRYGLFCHDEFVGGDVYGIRYSEALALECAYQRWRLDKLEAIILNN